ncbi:uncharacterized protein LOC143280470 [Babylonia areolata]|uniref:uncharacterized protein LOC143280470 n=1 Tax=Babylonia areolata TaxID=304850 RepID=UPI003FD0A23A
MDQNFRKRLQKTLYCGELEPEHCPLVLTELAVEYFQDLAPHKLDYVDLQSASTVTSQDSVSASSVAMSMVYAKRLQRRRPDYIAQVSSSDLFIISMMMASKYLYDEGVDGEVFNDEWAENAGLETDEINKMERNFLDALDWDLYIRKEDFDQAMLSIEKSIALREGLRRGWFSYTDLCLLLDETWMQLLGPDKGLEWLQVVAVSSAAYMVGVMNMVGSTILVTNACVALSSVGLLPVLLPALHTNLAAGPALHTSLAAGPALHTNLAAGPALHTNLAAGPGPLPALCPHPALGCPDMPPPVSGLPDNETRQEAEEEESKAGDEPWMGGQSVVDTILSQLMAVLTLKSHLAQFVYAVSDNYASHRDGNHSERKVPQYNHDSCLGDEEGAEGSDPEITTSRLESRLFHIGEAPADLDNVMGPCPKCKKKEADLCSGFVPTLSSCVQGCCKGDCWKGGKDDRDWLSSLKAQHCHEICPLYNCRAQTQSAKRCKNQSLATMSSPFPDIVIGFSTSMPPLVFAA